MSASIAIVGNAQHLFDRRYGAEIDKHDTVGRMNRAAILFTKPFATVSHGSKTDMWFMWRHKEYEAVNMNRPPFSMQMCPMEPLEDTSVNLFQKLRFEKLQQEIGAIPSTGLMVLDFVSSVMKWDKISVYGFDWKATPTFTDPNRETDTALNSGGHLHDFLAEQEYCRSRFYPDERFIFRF